MIEIDSFSSYTTYYGHSCDLPSNQGQFVRKKVFIHSRKYNSGTEAILNTFSGKVFISSHLTVGDAQFIAMYCVEMPFEGNF